MIVLTKIWWNIQPIVVCPIVETLVCFPEFGGSLIAMLGLGGIYRVLYFFNWGLIAMLPGWGIYRVLNFFNWGLSAPSPMTCVFQLRITTASCWGVNFSAILSISGSTKTSLGFGFTVELEVLPIK